MESNHVIVLFRHALNDRTSSGPMMSGNRGTRTHDLLVNSQVLCQLSYVPEYRFMKLSKSSCLLSIREECLFSFYADAAAESKMCDLNASSCSRSMRAAITPHSRKSGRRESNPPYPYRIRLIRPALLPMSYCPGTEKDRLSGFPSKRSLIIHYLSLRVPVLPVLRSYRNIQKLPERAFPCLDTTSCAYRCRAKIIRTTNKHCGLAECLHYCHIFDFR